MVPGICTDCVPIITQNKRNSMIQTHISRENNENMLIAEPTICSMEKEMK